MRKSEFAICVRTKSQISCTVTAQLISVFVFATSIEELIYLYSSFQASSLHTVQPAPLMTDY